MMSFFPNSPYLTPLPISAPMSALTPYDIGYLPCHCLTLLKMTNPGPLSSPAGRPDSSHRSEGQRNTFAPRSGATTKLSTPRTPKYGKSELAQSTAGFGGAFVGSVRYVQIWRLGSLARI